MTLPPMARRDKPQQQHQQKLIGTAARGAMGAVARWVCALDDEENERVMAVAAQAGTPVSGAMPGRGNAVASVPQL